MTGKQFTTLQIRHQTENRNEHDQDESIWSHGNMSQF